MEQVRQALIGGENVYLRGFGTFNRKHRAEKVARNISKNTTIKVPAHDIPAFKPSKEFLDKSNNPPFLCRRRIPLRPMRRPAHTGRRAGGGSDG